MGYGFVGSRIVYPKRKHLSTTLHAICHSSLLWSPFLDPMFTSQPRCLRAHRFAILILGLFSQLSPPRDFDHSRNPLRAIQDFVLISARVPELWESIPTTPRSSWPRRSDFTRKDPECHFLPNIPEIFALLEHLNSVINCEQPVYPRLGKHTPVTESAVVFGHHNFPPHAERTEFEKWCHVSPGLQYPCEADKRLNEAFYEDFNFPATAKADKQSNLFKFLGMNQSLSWFSKVKEVASDATTFFEGSGTLADCPPCGLPTNQVITLIHPPSDIPQTPTHSADSRSLYPFAYRLKTNARNLLLLAVCTTTVLFLFLCYYVMNTRI